MSQTLERFRRRDEPTHGVDTLLARSDPRAPFAERLEWLARLVHWVARPVRLPGQGEGLPAPQTTRLRYLLQLLERNPEWKGRAARSLRATLREVDALGLYCESGLPQEPGFFAEAWERLRARLLPRNPYKPELGSLLIALFPREHDARWLLALDGDTLARVLGLLSFDEQPEEAGWNAPRHDLADALLYLVSDLRTIGLSVPIRKRLPSRGFRELPFFDLIRAAEAMVSALAEDRGRIDTARAAFLERLEQCGRTGEEVRAHLGETGVSVRVVYRLERMDAQVRRLRDLTDLLTAADAAPDQTARFLAGLVRDTLARRKVRELATANLRLLARKVVDRSAQTGEHYIARDRSEYHRMLKSAAGGGALTALTTYAKLAISGLGLLPFLEGLLASLNYSLSFVLLHSWHFTLATKQPATTAPALASRLNPAETPAEAEALVDEAVHLIRSQAASVLGNVGLVLPTVLLLGLAWQLVSGHPFLGEHKAQHTLESFTLLGGTPLYAAFTGVLLFLSSLAAGTADNWFALHGLRDGIASSPACVALLGRARARGLAAYLSDNLSALVGSVALGFLLGMVPAIGYIVGLPLQVRHVTLSSGQLAAAVQALGPEALLTPAFAWAVAGIASMALLNVGVSFALALSLAIQARGVQGPARGVVRRALLRRLLTRPLSFLYPE